MIEIKEPHDYRSLPTCDHAVLENYPMANIIGNVIREIK